MGRNEPATPLPVTREGERDRRSAPTAGRPALAHGPAPGPDRAVQVGAGPAAQLGAAADPVRDVVGRLLGGRGERLLRGDLLRFGIQLAVLALRHPCLLSCLSSELPDLIGTAPPVINAATGRLRAVPRTTPCQVTDRSRGEGTPLFRTNISKGAGEETSATARNATTFKPAPAIKKAYPRHRGPPASPAVTGWPDGSGGEVRGYGEAAPAGRHPAPRRTPRRSPGHRQRRPDGRDPALVPGPA